MIAGDRQAPVTNVMTCLTITAETVDEAIAQNADLVVSHHPLPFRPIKKLTTDNVPSTLLWKLAKAGVSVYSPHTAFDSAAEGINHSLAARLGVSDVKPLAIVPRQSEEAEPVLGSGRYGRLAKPTLLSDFLQQVKAEFGLQKMSFVGEVDREVVKIAFACGSGGSFFG